MQTLDGRRRPRGRREGGNEEGPERDLRDQRPNPRPTSLSHVRVRMGRLKDFFKTYPSKYDTEAGAETETKAGSDKEVVRKLHI